MKTTPTPEMNHSGVRGILRTLVFGFLRGKISFSLKKKNSCFNRSSSGKQEESV